MLNQQQEFRRNVVEILSTEDLVPQNHLSRQIDRVVDFIRIMIFRRIVLQGQGASKCRSGNVIQNHDDSTVVGISSSTLTMEEIKVDVYTADLWDMPSAMICRMSQK